LYSFVEIGVLLGYVFMMNMTWLFEMYATYPLRRFVEIFYACCFKTYWRCHDYLL